MTHNHTNTDYHVTGEVKEEILNLVHQGSFWKSTYHLHSPIRLFAGLATSPIYMFEGPGETTKGFPGEVIIVGVNEKYPRQQERWIIRHMRTEYVNQQ